MFNNNKLKLLIFYHSYPVLKIFVVWRVKLLNSIKKNADDRKELSSVNRLLNEYEVLQFNNYLKISICFNRWIGFDSSGTCLLSWISARITKSCKNPAPVNSDTLCMLRIVRITWLRWPWLELSNDFRGQNRMAWRWTAMGIMSDGRLHGWEFLRSGTGNNSVPWLWTFHCDNMRCATCTVVCLILD